jgi:hypothetical protein
MNRRFELEHDQARCVPARLSRVGDLGQYGSYDRNQAVLRRKPQASSCLGARPIKLPTASCAG